MPVYRRDALPLIDARQYGVVADGVTDCTDAIHRASLAAFGAGGGRIVLPAGRIAVTGIELDPFVHLEGQSMRASEIWLANNSNVSVIKNHVSTDTAVADPNAQWIGVRNLQVNGNRANQSAGHGVELALSPSFPASKPAADDYYDSHQLVEHVRIIEVKQDGLNSGGRSENRFNNVITYKTDGYGFVVGSDTWLDYCTSSWAGLAGFKPTTGSSNIHIATCKSFYAGQVTAASGTGLHMANNFACHVTGFIAQDNKANGVLLDTGCQGNTLLGIIMDSNSTRSVGANPGLDIWDSQDNYIIGRCVERKADGTNSYQRNAVRVRNNSVRNTIYLSFHAENSAVLGQAVMDVLDDVNNRIEINGSRCGMILPITFATSYTPSPYSADVQSMTLTGNVTVNAPTETNIPPGTFLRFLFLQDATGGRTVTWNAVFKVAAGAVSTTANLRSSVGFVYDGTNWIQMDGVAGF